MRHLTTLSAADIIIENIEANLASLNAVGCRGYHNDQTIIAWSQRITGQIECLAILLGKNSPTVANLETDLGRAITEAKVNLYKRDNNITA